MKVTKKRSTGDEIELLRLTSGDFFGERALLKSDKRAANVIATSSVQCLALGRDDFVRLLGPLQDLMKRTIDEREARERLLVSRRASTATAATGGGGGGGGGSREVGTGREAVGDLSINFEELDPIATLGTGTFGRVRMVVHQPTGKVYALKSLMKAHVVATKQQVRARAMSRRVPPPPRPSRTRRDRRRT